MKRRCFFDSTLRSITRSGHVRRDLDVGRPRGRLAGRRDRHRGEVRALVVAVEDPVRSDHRRLADVHGRGVLTGVGRLPASTSSVVPARSTPVSVRTTSLIAVISVSAGRIRPSTGSATGYARSAATGSRSTSSDGARLRRVRVVVVVLAGHVPVVDRELRAWRRRRTRALDADELDGRLVLRRRRGSRASGTRAPADGRRCRPSTVAQSVELPSPPVRTAALSGIADIALQSPVWFWIVRSMRRSPAPVVVTAVGDRRPALRR